MCPWNPGYPRRSSKSPSMVFEVPPVTKTFRCFPGVLPVPRRPSSFPHTSPEGSICSPTSPVRSRSLASPTRTSSSRTSPKVVCVSSCSQGPQVLPLIPRRIRSSETFLDVPPPPPTFPGDSTPVPMRFPTYAWFPDFSGVSTFFPLPHCQ